MSIVKNYYVVAGYDLTGYKTDKFDDWEWTEEGEEYTCYQSKGEIQLFTDPMSGSHFYLGYILATGDEYDFETTIFNIKDIERQIPHVKNKFLQLQKIAVISRDPHLEPEFKIIVFDECR